MPWFKETCEDLVCGAGLGIVKGVFGLSFFSEAETEEIQTLRELAKSIIAKSPKIVTEPVICQGIKEGKKVALETFTNNASPEAVTAGVVAAAQLVCTKSFKERFASVLMGSCLNLVGCPL